MNEECSFGSPSKAPACVDNLWRIRDFSLTSQLIGALDCQKREQRFGDLFYVRGGYYRVTQLLVQHSERQISLKEIADLLPSRLACRLMYFLIRLHSVPETSLNTGFRRIHQNFAAIFWKTFDSLSGYILAVTSCQTLIGNNSFHASSVGSLQLVHQ